MYFNPINASWILGVNNKNKFSFNFKIDLLKPLQQAPITQDLRPGVGVLVLETGELTGHIQQASQNKGQFVTARTAWFMQLWLSDEAKENAHNLNGLLCQFDNWRGLYAMSLPEEDALRASVASAFDENGKRENISQFLEIGENKDHVWQIKIPSPLSTWSLESVLVNKSVITGFVSTKDQRGFCVITRELST